MLAHTRRCLALRSSTPTLRLGRMTILEAGDQLLRFERAHGGQRLLCSFNLSRYPVSVGAPSGRTLASTGEVDAGQLGAFAAVIEEVSPE